MLILVLKYVIISLIILQKGRVFILNLIITLIAITHLSTTILSYALTFFFLFYKIFFKKRYNGKFRELLQTLLKEKGEIQKLTSKQKLELIFILFYILALIMNFVNICIIIYNLYSKQLLAVIIDIIKDILKEFVSILALLKYIEPLTLHFTYLLNIIVEIVFSFTLILKIKQYNKQLKSYSEDSNSNETNEISETIETIDSNEDNENIKENKKKISIQTIKLKKVIAIFFIIILVVSILISALSFACNY